jgi:FKBP-type peptidyl-prolyl cis-trans isomerase FkpA
VQIKDEVDLKVLMRGIETGLSGEAAGDQRGRGDGRAAGLRPALQAKREGEMQAGAKKNREDGEAFMAEQVQAGRADHRVRPAVQGRDRGRGPRPAATDTVKVHYTGTLLDGTKFDSSVDRGEPAQFALNQVIPGWTEALQLMPSAASTPCGCPPNWPTARTARPARSARMPP